MLPARRVRLLLFVFKLPSTGKFVLFLAQRFVDSILGKQVQIFKHDLLSFRVATVVLFQDTAGTQADRFVTQFGNLFYFDRLFNRFSRNLTCCLASLSALVEFGSEGSVEGFQSIGSVVEFGDRLLGIFRLLSFGRGRLHSMGPSVEGDLLRHLMSRIGGLLDW